MFNNSFNEFHSFISQMDENNLNNPKYLLDIIDKNKQSLKISKSFTLKMRYLNKDFNFNIDSFYSYIISLKNHLKNNGHISKKDIQVLKEIIKLEKMLVPNNSNVSLYTKNSYYDNLITKNGYYNKLSPNQLYPSLSLKNILNKIDKICIEAENRLNSSTKKEEF